MEATKHPTVTTEVFASHANATLTPTGGLRLARRVLEHGWTPAGAAERFGLSLTAVRRRGDRSRELGKAGRVDRSSRPTPSRTARHFDASAGCSS
ncbi:leucine zipper domain-containing protein [Dietzia psychralcaliphila]|uniref:leucine zipper domain-containing protein n=1 Tax=Dietzia psychralcaliphila TaxID=139021 RepID=UPI001C1E28FC